MEIDLSRPVVTVATLVMREGAFLCVEEETRRGIKFNQPAGHLEAGESLPAAAVRETLEETGYHVVPTALVGIYRWHAPGSASTFIRFAFAADVASHDAARALDRGIVRAVWLDHEALLACRADHRSPLVLRCIDDFRSGQRLPLSVLTEIL